MVTPIALRGIAILVPVVTPASFAIIAPQNSGYIVGQVFASNFPTAWSIVAGDDTSVLTDINGVILTDAALVPLTTDINVLTDRTGMALMDSAGGTLMAN